MIPKNPQSKRTTDALVKAACRRGCLIQRYARDLAASNRELGCLMVARYGNRFPATWTSGLHMDDITLEGLDTHMASVGFPSLKP